MYCVHVYRYNQRYQKVVKVHSKPIHANTGFMVLDCSHPNLGLYRNCC